MTDHRMPNIPIDEYMEHIKGPDFPTGATIHGLDGIQDMYSTGKEGSMSGPNAMLRTMPRESES